MAEGEGYTEEMTNEREGRGRGQVKQSQEGDSLSIHLILPNSSTLSVNVARSTTLGELRKYRVTDNNPASSSV